MNLIYVAPFLHPPGGLERTLVDKAGYLVVQGHQVLLLTYAQGREPMFYTPDARVQHRDLDCRLSALYRHPFYARLQMYLRLRRQFRQRFLEVVEGFRPDTIVVTIPNTEDYIRDVSAVARQRGVRLVVESHLASHFHLADKPFSERLLCWLFPPRAAIRQADRLVALTSHDARHWRQLMPRVSVIPNPVTPSALEPCPPTTASFSRRIVAAGRLFRQKRFDRLVQAFARLAADFPDWSLDIFGDGPLRQSLQQQIDGLQLSRRVRLLPPTHRLFDEYRRSALFVLSSDYEGFGLVVLEAMACGLPVVATDCPHGPSEIIADGDTGLLARMDDADLARKMAWMMSHDNRRQQIGQQARAAAARYSMEVVMPQWEQAYFSVIP